MAEQDKQADVSKHTPGDLLFWSWGSKNDPSCVLAVHDGDLLFQTLGGNDRANAKHLLKCWNSHEPGGSHDALVEALKKISTAENKRKKSCGYDIEIDEIAKAALELAKKGA